MKQEDVAALTQELGDTLPSIARGYDKLAAQLTDLLPNSTDDAGIWRLPHGERMYSYFLRFYTTDLTAREIHEIGIKEVER